MIHVYQYGAVGDGKTDDTQAIRDAIDASHRTGQAVHFDARVYVVTDEIRIDKPSVLVGLPPIGNWNGTHIAARKPMRSVLRLGATVEMHGIRAEGGRQADHGLLLAGCHNAKFSAVRVTGARKDGVRLAARNDANGSAINDDNMWERCTIQNNGTVYGHPLLKGDVSAPYLHPSQWEESTTHTAVVTQGSKVVSLAGAPPVRLGDPLVLGVGEHRRYRLVTAIVGSGVVEVSLPIEYSAQDVPYAACVGDGYHEEKHGDNNLAHFSGGVSRGNAGYQLALDGLYGHRIEGTKIEYAPTWGVRVGLVGSRPVINGAATLMYFETIGSGFPWLFRAALAWSCRSIMDRQYEDSPIDYQGQPHNCRGEYFNDKGRRKIGSAYGTGAAAA